MFPNQPWVGPKKESLRPHAQDTLITLQPARRSSACRSAIAKATPSWLGSNQLPLSRGSSGRRWC